MVEFCLNSTYPYDSKAAVEYLTEADSTLGRLIAQIGQYGLELRTDLNTFQALFRSIVYQQLSGHAAKSILNRVLDLHDGNFPTPAQIILVSDETLRSCGLSRSKIRAANDLAQKTEKNLLPDETAIQSMSDDELVDAFTSVFGIGRWTVEMLLIFHLGRPDILPGNDLGIRRGFKVAYSLPEMPTPGELMKHGDIWRPYRSVASWYLWRAADPKFSFVQ